jgi:murein DD-endopeptidase MepM/ murein hydrolase activator NlpD
MNNIMRKFGLTTVVLWGLGCSAGASEELDDPEEMEETEQTEEAMTTGFGLPFPSGAAYTISQGPHNGYSHVAPYNQHAVDFAMPIGARVVASGAGRVAYSGWFHGEIRVIVDHGHNRCTLYTHLNRALPYVGKWVRRGEHIGESGATGRVTGPHLHWNMIHCNNWTSREVVPTDELGRNYRTGMVARSANWLR